MLMVAAKFDSLSNTYFSSCSLKGAGSTPRREVIGMAKIKIGRNAEDGRFVPVKTAQLKWKTHVVETIKTDPKKDK